MSDIDTVTTTVGCIEPSVADTMPFRYQPLELDQQVFRLIQVQPREPNAPIKITMWQSDMSTQYRCLSYMWGDQTERHTVVVNNRTFGVGRNLYDFLDYACQHHPNQPLWIDAICIDQNNKAERGHQVQRMGQIYSGAEEVLVWLGREFEFDLIAEWLKAIPGGDYCSREVEQQLLSVCFHPYWSRAWIAQEILLQSNVKILQQQASIPWGEFGLKVLPLRVQSFARDAPVMPLIEMWLERYIQDWTTDASVHVWISSGQSLSFSFWQLLENRKEAQCSDSRDRIYSLLAMPAADGPRTHLKANYEESSIVLFMKAGELLGAWCVPKRVELLMRALSIDLETLRESLKNYSEIWVTFYISHMTVGMLKNIHGPTQVLEMCTCGMAGLDSRSCSIRESPHEVKRTSAIAFVAKRYQEISNELSECAIVIKRRSFGCMEVHPLKHCTLQLNETSEEYEEDGDGPLEFTEAGGNNYVEGNWQIRIPLSSLLDRYAFKTFAGTGFVFPPRLFTKSINWFNLRTATERRPPPLHHPDPIMAGVGYQFWESEQ